jgi:hypothetical protein
MTPSSLISFADPSWRHIHIPVQRDSVRAVQLATALLMTDIEDDDENQFDGGLVWLADWAIWSEATERVGHRLLQALRGSAAPALRDSPAHVLSGTGSVDAQALLALPILFQWDAYFIPTTCRFVVFVSHDEFVKLVPRDDASFDNLMGRFESGGWMPQERVLA